MVNTITVAGPYSGQNYRFRVAGDRPTVDEQREIDAYIRQREEQFDTQWQETGRESGAATTEPRRPRT